ncbi:uncharacterized protein TNCV_4111811 [Trichonephila clavipes]|nr:uncharacterized protein TNCV_4111811 [Trichonephila clavipes]
MPAMIRYLDHWATAVPDVFVESRVPVLMEIKTRVSDMRNNLRQSASKLGLDGSFTFQRDNDPKHTARVVWEWLLYNVRKPLKTPPQSLELTPMEHLWDYLDNQIRKQEIKTKNNLKKSLWEARQKIPSSLTLNLVNSVSSRLRAVKAKCYPANYYFFEKIVQFAILMSLFLFAYLLLLCKLHPILS